MLTPTAKIAAAEGLTDRDEILESRLAALKEERDGAKAALDRIHVTERPSADIAPELMKRFGRLVRENATAGEIPFRKAWRQVIVEVRADVIRIIGDKASLETVIAGAGSPAAPGVRMSVRKWRARKDSNL